MNPTQQASVDRFRKHVICKDDILNVVSHQWSLLNVREFDDAYKAPVRERVRTLQMGYINECAWVLLGAELDCRTPGSRGIGRLGKNPPRLGAFRRSRIARLESSDLDEVYDKLRGILLAGLASSLNVVPDRNPREDLSDLRWREEGKWEWLGLIYVTALPQTDGVRLFHEVCSEPFFFDAYEVLREKGVWPLLPHRRRVMALIFLYYWRAGFLLGGTEGQLAEVD